MKYSKVKLSDISSGPGVRTSIYVSGCTHNCPGCFNPETHNFNYGKEWTREIEDKIIDHVKKNNISGLNLLGGDPLQQVHDDTLLNFVIRFREETNKDVWVWTGYSIEDILKNKSSRAFKILLACDVCIDGKYLLEKNDPKLRYMGSSNQRVIDIKKTIIDNKVVIYEKSL